MKEKPYRILTSCYTTEKIVINIPKYFSNYQYFKIKLISASTKYTGNNLWMICDNMNYDAIYGDGIYKYDKYMFNISLVTKGYSVKQYAIIPYKDNITLTFGGINETITNTVQLVLELEPINFN